MKNFRNNKGITLIALVITIIVLLILAGVSITTIVGDSGVISKASKAKEEVHISSDKESVDMAVLEYEMEKLNSETDMLTFLSQYNNDWTVEKNDNEIKINVNSCGHTYTISMDEDLEEVPEVPITPEVPEEPEVPEYSYLWEVAQNGDYVEYYGTKEIEEYSWVVLDVDKDTQTVKLLRVVCWYDKMDKTPTNDAEHALYANEVVRENNKYYNPDFLESADKVTALTVEEVTKNNGSFVWMEKVKNSYLVAGNTCALVGNTGYADSVYAIDSHGQISYYAFGAHYVRAVVELKADILVTGGTGTSGDGYQIAVE